MRIHISIELPDGRSAEFTETPNHVSWDQYRAHARAYLDRQYEAAKRWLDDQERPRKTAGPAGP